MYPWLRLCGQHQNQQGALTDNVITPNLNILPQPVKCENNAGIVNKKYITRSLLSNNFKEYFFYMVI